MSGISVAQALRKSEGFVGAAALTVGVVGVVSGWIGFGPAGLWHGLSAGAVVLVLAAITFLTNRLALRNLDFLLVIMLGSFVIKLLVLVVCLAVAKVLDMSHPRLFGSILLAGIVVVMVVELVVLPRYLRGSIISTEADNSPW